MTSLAMCRICLSEDVRMYCIMNTNLQEIYETLCGTLLDTRDGRPSQVCYICYARLQNCYRLRTACVRNEELLTHMLRDITVKCKPPPFQYMKMLKLVSIPILNLSIDPVVHKDLKLGASVDHHNVTQDSLALIDDVQVKEEYVAEKREEDIKAEEVNSGDIDMLDYSITTETNKQSSQDHTIVNNKLETNDINSPMSMDDILFRRTVKIELHRIDLNQLQKSAVINKQKFNDLQDSAPCTSSRISKNEVMFQPNKNIDIDHSGIAKNTSEKCFNKCSLLKNIHMHTSEKPYKCSTCEKCFCHKNSLLIHIRTHTGERPYKCSTCQKCFSCKSNLLTHISTHTGERPYKCSTCEKCFSRKGTLLYHIRTHRGERPHKCSTCEKCYNRKSDLLIHIRTHTGERPYKCSACDKCFNVKSNLTKHISNTHR